MNHKNLHNTVKGPEAKIQQNIKDMLTLKGWLVEEMHGNLYQFGIPDLFATSRQYGHRWIEVKNPVAYSFTNAQLDKFPKLIAFGSGVWVLIAATEEEYLKLFQPSNFWQYLSIWRSSKAMVHVH